jgi:hypothetical protein
MISCLLDLMEKDRLLAVIVIRPIHLCGDGIPRASRCAMPVVFSTYVPLSTVTGLFHTDKTETSRCCTTALAQDRRHQEEVSTGSLALFDRGSRTDQTGTEPNHLRKNLFVKDHSLAKPNKPLDLKHPLLALAPVPEQGVHRPARLPLLLPARKQGGHLTVLIAWMQRDLVCPWANRFEAALAST